MNDIGTRYICDILSDLRESYNTRNFSYMLGLLEELQYRANRMENRIEMIHDIERMEQQRIELKKSIRELEEKRARLASTEEKT